MPNKLTLAVSLAITINPSFAQTKTPPNIRQNAARSQCSNIIALTGNIDIKCSQLTPEQAKIISSIPVILKKVLSHQLDPDAVMRKLDEIEAAQKASNQTVIAPGGIGSIGGTLVNPTVNNIGYMQKDLTEDQVAAIANIMRPFAKPKDRGDLLTCEMGDSNSCSLGRALVRVFRSAGWNLPGTGLNQAMHTQPVDPVLVLVKSAPPLATQQVTSPVGLPSGAFQLAQALSNLGIHVGFGIDPTLADDEFRVQVGVKP